MLTLLSASRCEMAAGGCLLLLLLPLLIAASHSPPGCKIRITSKGLDLGKGPARERGTLGTLLESVLV